LVQIVKLERIMTNDNVVDTSKAITNETEQLIQNGIDSVDRFSWFIRSYHG